MYNHKMAKHEAQARFVQEVIQGFIDNCFGMKHFATTRPCQRGQRADIQSLFSSLNSIFQSFPDPGEGPILATKLILQSMHDVYRVGKDAEDERTKTYNVAILVIAHINVNLGTYQIICPNRIDTNEGIKPEFGGLPAWLADQTNLKFIKIAKEKFEKEIY
jgi:hypothetical protein